MMRPETEIKVLRTAVVVLLVIVGWLANVALARGADFRTIALADVRRFAPGEQGYYAYIRTDLCDDPQAVLTALRFVLPSFSREVVIERQLPVAVAEGLYRIDIRGLGWRYDSWRDGVLKQNPYELFHPARLQVLDAKWLVTLLSDNEASDAGYRLLYGKPFKTRQEFLKSFEISEKPEHTFGFIEGKSGVALQRTRFIGSHPGPRIIAYGTKDVETIDRNSDPLEHPDGQFRHDAEEWIVPLQKASYVSNRRGVLQAYALFNGRGERQDAAPTTVVADATRFRGYPHITNSGSCIQCHATGLNPLSQDAYRQLLAIDGVQLKAKKFKQEEVERLMSGFGADLKRQNEDFAVGVELACGVKPADAVKAFTATVGYYDADLTPTQAAREVDCLPQEFKDALAYASNRGIDLGARLSALAAGRDIPRKSWESQIFTARHAVELWRSK